MNNYGLFNAKAIFLERQKWYNLTHKWEYKGVHTFLKGICSEVNIIARLRFELTYNDAAVNVNNKPAETLPQIYGSYSREIDDDVESLISEEWQDTKAE